MLQALDKRRTLDCAPTNARHPSPNALAPEPTRSTDSRPVAQSAIERRQRFSTAPRNLRGLLAALRLRRTTNQAPSRAGVQCAGCRRLSLVDGERAIARSRRRAVEDCGNQ